MKFLLDTEASTQGLSGVHILTVARTSVQFRRKKKEIRDNECFSFVQYN